MSLEHIPKFNCVVKPEIFMKPSNQRIIKKKKILCFPLNVEKIFFKEIFCSETEK